MAFHVGNGGSNPPGDAKLIQGISPLVNPFFSVTQSPPFESNLDLFDRSFAQRVDREICPILEIYPEDSFLLPSIHSINACG